MKIVRLSDLKINEREMLLSRPAINNEDIFNSVRPILQDVKQNGLKAILKYAETFDGYRGNNFRVNEDEFIEAEKVLSFETKEALKTAAKNIEKFHTKEIPADFEIETMPGIKCRREFRPIDNAGLYIPGGSTPLPSTLLMLGIPAKLAGCKRIFACSPSKDDSIHPALLFAARIAGVDEIYKFGGAQAVGLMAYGTEEIKKADKIFGPGNQYVTAAKSIVSIDYDGCAIDMPAGPSEVLVIADDKANPEFIAADLLSQAEHGYDSQALLVTNSIAFAHLVNNEIDIQITLLPREETASAALKNSFILVVDSIIDAIEFSNDYAPEHLILNFEKCEDAIPKIKNAGSIFVGPYSPESVGDYASGTNHSLPTYGYAKSYSGIGVEAFMKSITIQKLSEEGLNNIAPTVITLAETEKLHAHANAVKLRVK